ncbi:hypothetical protein [Parafilimonas terrae]|uniref:PRTRC system protein F n=1 Tax=Parafilimonas terrae TaxID=1465490 RepID=A0A1I5TBR0_9BACT|nr:hypothetical protein [Parafilimonas terrae]SFP80261.1 hypothetical protein SAMN05444277_10228 [Parafilimonas terrae]
MTNAGTYHIGYHTHALKAEAEAVAATAKRVYQLDAADKGRSRSAKRQTAVCADSDAANGFLKTTFLPKLEETKTVQTGRASARMERDFYQSLSQLAGHYHIQPMQTQSYGYPYNIALALWDMEKLLKENVRDWQESKLLEGGRKIFLTSEERYSTGSMLYYIPVVSLYRMLKNPKRKHAAQLLLSVCSYLYFIAGVPYYRREDSFLYGEYEMLKEWVLTDDDTDETGTYLGEIEQAEWIGDRMEQKICNRANLTVFKKRLMQFESRNTLDHDCWQLACEAFDLYEQYPNDNIFRNAHVDAMTGGDEEDCDEDEMENVITMDRYISFCADGRGWLHENLVQCVNTEWQEYGQAQEPVIIKRFDGNDITGGNLDFENRLFALMDELVYTLNHL